MVGLPVTTGAFWSGRRVLLTGHTGFKGAWFSVWLSALGADVTGFSDAVPTKRSLFADAVISDIVTDVRGDVRDLAAVERTIRDSRPDIIMHLAAQSLVRRSYASPVDTYTTNVIGVVNVLEGARRAADGCPVLVITTDKCYENREWVWGYREEEAMGGHDPYSSSKGCAELVASAYHRSFSSRSPSFRVATARAGNVIGGGDWSEDRLIPDMIRSIESEQPAEIRNPDAIRPWQHVLEPLSGYLLLGQRLLERAPVDGQGWNFGPAAEAEVPVRVVADLLCSLWPDAKGWRSTETAGQPHEAQTLRLDVTKARTRRGWHPRWSLEQALAASVAVYRSQKRGPDLRSLLREQIEHYGERQRGSSLGTS